MTQPYELEYAFNAFGGFKLKQDFPLYRPTGDGYRPYKLNDAIQIKYSVRDMNYKIGVVLDDSESTIIQFDASSNYGASNNNQHTNIDQLVDDVLDITSQEFIDTINASSVVSMGKMSTLYSDFLETINTYFGSPIIVNNNIFNINNGVFDASAFVHLINGGNFNINGSFVSDFSGEIHVYDINSKLRNAFKRNLFNNRTGTNYKVNDGFVDGDLIYVPDGMTVTLKLDIDHGANIDIYSGPANLQKIEERLNYYDSATRVRKTTTYSNTNITQTYTVPILLIASNTEFTYSYDNYGLNWNPILQTLGPRNWNFVSVSATGQYQNAIDLSGHIYTTQDFGVSWSFAHDISYSEINTIDITHEGRYQTASNGHSIFTSSDYGKKWNLASTLQGVQVYLSISLTGQYQKVISAGDSIYSSSDYGATWSRLDDGSDLYYSIQGFPTASIAMSYNGQYQVIVSETIYISSNYGTSFSTVFIPGDPFADRNWIDVDISSEGATIVAIDNGGKVYRSTNYGSTWAIVGDDDLNVDKLWRNVSISGDGRYMTLLQDNGFIYYSKDYGVTWEPNNDANLANRQWRCVDVCTSGHYQTACEFNGYIYVSNLL